MTKQLSNLSKIAVPKARFRGLGFSALVLLLSIGSPSVVNAAQKSAEQTCESFSEWKDDPDKQVEAETYKMLCDKGEAELKKSIGAEFIKKILTIEKYTKVLPKRLTIKGFTISGKLDLSLEEIDKELNFLDATFLEQLNFKNANFKKSLSFKGSKLQKGIDFVDGEVGGTLDFTKSEFGNQPSITKCSNNAFSYNFSDDQKSVLANLKRIQVGVSIIFKNATVICSLRPDKSIEGLPNIEKGDILRDVNLPLDLSVSKIKTSGHIEK